LLSSHRITTGGQEVTETAENGCNEENDAAAIAPADDDDDDDSDLPLPEWVREVDRDILASYNLDADNDIVTAETQTEEDTAMEVKIKINK
jgi:hypothetical protein